MKSTLSPVEPPKQGISAAAYEEYLRAYAAYVAFVEGRRAASKVRSEASAALAAAKPKAPKEAKKVAPLDPAKAAEKKRAKNRRKRVAKAIKKAEVKAKVLSAKAKAEAASLKLVKTVSNLKKAVSQPKPTYAKVAASQPAKTEGKPANKLTNVLLESSGLNARERRKLKRELVAKPGVSERLEAELADQGRALREDLEMGHTQAAQARVHEVQARAPVLAQEIRNVRPGNLPTIQAPSVPAVFETAPNQSRPIQRPAPGPYKATVESAIREAEARRSVASELPRNYQVPLYDVGFRNLLVSVSVDQLLAADIRPSSDQPAKARYPDGQLDIHLAGKAYTCRDVGFIRFWRSAQ